MTNINTFTFWCLPIASFHFALFIILLLLIVNLTITTFLSLLYRLLSHSSQQRKSDCCGKQMGRERERLESSQKEKRKFRKSWMKPRRNIHTCPSACSSVCLLNYFYFYILWHFSFSLKCIFDCIVLFYNFSQSFMFPYQLCYYYRQLFFIYCSKTLTFWCQVNNYKTFRILIIHRDTIQSRPNDESS